MEYWFLKTYLILLSKLADLNFQIPLNCNRLAQVVQLCLCPNTRSQIMFL